MAQAKQNELRDDTWELGNPGHSESYGFSQWPDRSSSGGKSLHFRDSERVLSCKQVLSVTLCGVGTHPTFTCHWLTMKMDVKHFFVTLLY